MDWPARDGMWLGFGVYSRPPNESFISIERRGAPGGGGGAESYGAAGGGYVQTSDASGSLRLRRTNSRLIMSYRHGSQWVKLGTVNSVGPAALDLIFAGNDPQFGHQPATVAFDNFEAFADTVQCSGVALPPRKPCP